MDARYSAGSRGYTAGHWSDGFGAGREAGEASMNAEAWTILAVGVALGSLVWRMLRSLHHDMERQFGDVGKKFDGIGKNFDDVGKNFDDVGKKFDDVGKKFDGIGKNFDEVNRKFDEVAENFRDMRDRLDRLADDHHGLARELSELRGELRGRFDERVRPAPG